MSIRAPASAATLTFLFSDIEGSTRLLESLGSVAYTTVLERQAALLRAAFAAHGGREEATEGDSFFVLFDSAVEAVMAAGGPPLVPAARGPPIPRGALGTPRRKAPREPQPLCQVVADGLRVD